MGMDRHAIDQLARTLDDDLFSRLQTAGDDPGRADLRSYLHRLDVHLVVGVDHGHLIGALQLGDSTLRYQQRATLDLGLRPHLAVLARAQEALRIGEGSRYPDGAGIRVDLTIDKDDAALAGVHAAVGKRQFDGHAVGAVQQIGAAGSAHLVREREILLLADGEVNLNRLHLRNSREHGGLRDQAADLGGCDAGDAVQQGAHLRPAEIQLGAFDRGLLRLDGGLVRSLRLQIVVQLRARNGTCLGERRIALGVDLGQQQLRLRLRQLSLGLVERGLEGPGVDLVQDLPRVHLRALFVVLADQVAGDLGLNLRIGVSIEIRDPVAEDRHILLLHGCGRHLRGRILGRPAAFGGVAAAGNQREPGQQQQHRCRGAAGLAGADGSIVIILPEKTGPGRCVCWRNHGAFPEKSVRRRAINS